MAVQAVIPFVPALAYSLRATPLDAVLALAPSLVAQVLRLDGRTRVT